MENKTPIVIAVLVVLAAGAWALSTHLLSQKIDPVVQQEFSWGFVDLGVNATTSTPTTHVLLKIAGVEVPVGTYDGTCFAVIGSQWQLLANEVTGAICYWAGGGKEIGVFQDGSHLVLKEGDVDEGSAEAPGARGNFVELEKL